MTLSVGLFLNTSVIGRMDAPEALALMTAQAIEGEATGYAEAWVSEHHFEGYGVNPSALAAAGFLLGRTSRLRIGSAVVLTPHYHPLQLVEQTILLDRLSGGRFTLGVGRGGFQKEFTAFQTPEGRWEDEPSTTIRILCDAWRSGTVAHQGRAIHFPPVRVVPSPRPESPPPFALASSSPDSIALAAEAGAPLLHYWATPLEHRMRAEAAYAEAAAAAGHDAPAVEHVHQVMVAISPQGDSPALRTRLGEAALDILRHGDSPPVASVSRKLAETPLPPLDVRARSAVAHGLVGTPEQVAAGLAGFITSSGARRIVAFHELLGTPGEVLDSVARFARDVVPMLGSSLMTSGPPPE